VQLKTLQKRKERDGAPERIGGGDRKAARVCRGARSGHPSGGAPHPDDVTPTLLMTPSPSPFLLMMTPSLLMGPCGSGAGPQCASGYGGGESMAGARCAPTHLLEYLFQNATSGYNLFKDKICFRIQLQDTFFQDADCFWIPISERGAPRHDSGECVASGGYSVQDGNSAGGG
jgi:hypothetical protein